MRLGLVGCGYVADYYISTLPMHPELSVAGVWDRDAPRLTQFCDFHGVTAFPSLEALLASADVDAVVNLTNPASHFEISRSALNAGKHVYSEKPLATDFADARALVELAEEKGVELSCAPCSMLGETAQTIWRAVRDDVIGQVRLVYAEMDEGLVFTMPHRRWTSTSGAPWPAVDEFEVGTTIEHAAYVVGWLPAMFGPVTTISGFSSVLFPDKGTADQPIPVTSPDLVVACLTFASGVVARVTCSLVAPHDHSLTLVGDRGVLSTEDTWYYSSKVKIRRWFNARGRHVQIPDRTYPLVGSTVEYTYKGTQEMDFSRGIAEMSAALREGRRSRMAADYSLHVNEIVLALANSLGRGATYRMTTTFVPPEPMPWATEPRRTSTRDKARDALEALAAKVGARL